MTPAEYKRQQAADRRAEREAAEAHALAPGVPYGHGWESMRRQDFDSSVPLSLLDETTARAGSSTRRKADATGTPDIFD